MTKQFSIISTVRGEEPWLHPKWIRHTQILLDSYEKWVGKPLIERSGDAVQESETLFRAPFVVASHNLDPDPILNYGNRTALELWEVSLEEFLQMPSRKTAEPMEREERARMLERSERDGFIDDYSGIRISASGRRFQIDRAIIWNLIDEDGSHQGQAATFSEWKFLGETER